ncbi:MAG: diadenylate cyclase CdaA [Phycisphaerales bacterium]
MLEKINQLIARIGEYEPLPVLFELVILWIIFYALYRFVRGTRAAGALKGLLFVLIIATLVLRVFAQGVFPRLAVLYDQFLSIATIALIVTFQPELRRALIRLGEAPFFRTGVTDFENVIASITDAMTFLSKNNFGAIVAIERNVGMRELIESGRKLDAEVSSHLLTTIFWPNSPLHDMGVVIRGDRVIAAGVQFPLAQPADLPDEHLGTRHRAALGLTRVTDALVIVVSEETGTISIAEQGRLDRRIPPEELASELRTRLKAQAQSEDPVADIAKEMADGDA